ncbi:carbon storage regulator CsrA [Priestia taiwanensis]|uniref:Translational regulator CsrA n=1 Tax=Priestia taiwanensis TaxID=1347902 RepID=A0A917ESW4_9BACI|nr:carbon storage regulator CsrA [Priestia taiwanensis]MBM7364381.1 carbon storage regulator [Priestia taiwanensis]GGE84905.1 carbon storage regulator [Priestia taiwanensis]
MLVLTRKIKEAIMIGDDIEISVAAIEGDQVKLAISAPKHIDIHRKEIYLSIRDENKQAVNTPDSFINFLQNSKKNNEND